MTCKECGQVVKLTRTMNKCHSNTELSSHEETRCQFNGGRCAIKLGIDVQPGFLPGGRASGRKWQQIRVALPYPLLPQTTQRSIPAARIFVGLCANCQIDKTTQRMKIA